MNCQRFAFGVCRPADYGTNLNGREDVESRPKSIQLSLQCVSQNLIFVAHPVAPAPSVITSKAAINDHRKTGHSSSVRDELRISSWCPSVARPPFPSIASFWARISGCGHGGGADERRAAHVFERRRLREELLRLQTSITCARISLSLSMPGDPVGTSMLVLIGCRRGTVWCRDCVGEARALGHSQNRS